MVSGENHSATIKISCSVCTNAEHFKYSISWKSNFDKCQEMQQNMFILQFVVEKVYGKQLLKFYAYFRFQYFIEIFRSKCAFFWRQTPPQSISVTMKLHTQSDCCTFCLFELVVIGTCKFTWGRIYIIQSIEWKFVCVFSNISKNSISSNSIGFIYHCRHPQKNCFGQIKKRTRARKGEICMFTSSNIIYDAIDTRLQFQRKLFSFAGINNKQ